MSPVDPAEVIVYRKSSLLARLLAVGYIVVVLLIFFAFRQRNHDLARITYRNCAAIEALKQDIRAQEMRALATIPHLAYYRAHPAERRRAVALAREALRRFRPTPCT